MGSSSTPTAITDAEKASAQANTQAPTPPEPETPAADNATNEAPGTGTQEAPRSVPVLDDLHKLLDDTKAATNQTQVHELVEKIRQWVKENL